jgi:hypothetical protein
MGFALIIIGLALGPGGGARNASFSPCGRHRTAGGLRFQCLESIFGDEMTMGMRCSSSPA